MLTRILISFLLIIAASSLGYMGAQAFMKNPCTIPKTWTIESIDPRFNISTSSLISYTKEAANLWNEAYAPNPLFAYEPLKAEITIHLIYDERQRTTIQNERLKQTIEQGRTELSSIKETIDSLQTEYKALTKEISNLSPAYNTELAAYNKEVAYWNAQGGAPANAYQRLARDQATLETKRTQLNTKINRYNRLADQIRTYAEDHNQVVGIINEKIETLNETGPREFEEGTYDPNTNTITIYEFSSILALKRVLAHELGHALGLDHVERKEAIMYSVNQGDELLLDKADTDELAMICRERTLKDAIETVKIIRDDIVLLAEWSWHGIAARLQ